MFRLLHIKIYLLGLMVIIFGCQSKNYNTIDKSMEEFNISRGVNISHWLSQSNRRGAERANFFTADDMNFISRQGYDHIRIPIDEQQMWDEAGNKHSEAFQLLHQGIKWANDRDLKVVVDLHILRSHHFNDREKPLWTEPAAQQKFLDLWKSLSGELKAYPHHLLAYELMNEPVADDPEQWNNLLKRCYQVVRENEPERMLVIGSNRWQSVHTFADLKVPDNDSNILLSFHFYIPHIITHYQASWTHIKDYQGPIHYPGLTVKDEDLEGLGPELYQTIKSQQAVYNIDTLQKLMELPLQVADKYGLKLYCGEWGCYSKTPDSIRWRWYRDVRQSLEKYHIAWANWDYKGGFGIVDHNGEPNGPMLEALFDQ